MKNTALSQESIQNALNKFSEWFPEQAAGISQHKEELVSHILNGTVPAAGTAMAALKVGSFAMPESKQRSITLPKIPPCEMAIGVAVLSAGSFTMSLMGLKVIADEDMSRALLREAGEETLNGFQIMLNGFKEAEGALDKAKALFSIAGKLYNVGGFKVILKAWKDEADWYDWVRAGATSIAQLMIWFASDALAFIGEAMFTIMSAIDLEQAVVKAVGACRHKQQLFAAIARQLFVAEGPYLFTAEDVTIVLTADCRNFNGEVKPSSIVITGLPDNAAIANVNGVLHHTGNWPEGARGYLPRGTYLASSANASVTLSVTCTNQKGARVHATLDITNLPFREPIYNIDGTLVAASKLSQ